MKVWNRCANYDQKDEKPHPVRVLQSEDQWGFHSNSCEHLLVNPLRPVIRILSSVMEMVQVSLNLDIV
jgi:hypothetical protein